MRTLCLSGGGFRATIFHAGTIAALRAMNLLSDIENIVSVSGGSIAAAHVNLNSDEYHHLDADVFLLKLRELLEITSLDVRGRIVRRWLLLGSILSFRRSAQLIRHYERLYDKKNLGDLRAGKEGKKRPSLFIASTD